jgi:hypothetical protein
MQTTAQKVVRKGLIAVAVVLAGWTYASAQGMYYKEIRKDDRIYVFNDAKEAERFEKTGELGRALTRPGAGPNGETVVADSERALELFFFKYGISEPVTQPPPPPPPAPPWRLSGYMFGDFYHFAQDHDPKFDDQNGFWFRRIYFTYDHAFSPRFATRFRLEMNSNGTLTSTNLTPYVKDAYLRWTYFGRQQLFLGIQPTATFDFIEGFWGLRHIEKTPADLYRIDSSRDFAIGFQGPLNESQTVKYVAQIGNNSSQNSEVDTDKAVRLSARYEANPGIVVEGFYSFLSMPNNADRHIGQGFVGFRGKKGRAAFQYLYNRRNAARGTEAPDLDLNVYSGFGVFDFVPEKWTVFGRVDRFDDPNPDGPRIDYLPIANNAKYTFLLAGVEYYLFRSVRIGPNIEWVNYDDPVSGDKLDDDVVFRATFYWIW